MTIQQNRCTGMTFTLNRWAKENMKATSPEKHTSTPGFLQEPIETLKVPPRTPQIIEGVNMNYWLAMVPWGTPGVLWGFLGFLVTTISKSVAYIASWHLVRCLCWAHGLRPPLSTPCWYTGRVNSFLWAPSFSLSLVCIFISNFLIRLQAQPVITSLACGGQPTDIRLSLRSGRVHRYLYH